MSWQPPTPGVPGPDERPPWHPPAAAGGGGTGASAPSPPPPGAPTSTSGAVLLGVPAAQQVRRAFDWKLHAVVPSEPERRALAAAGVQEPHVQQLLCWRRSALLVSLPMLVLAAVLSVAETLDIDDSAFSDLGKVLNWLPTLALWLLPLGAVLAITRWTRLGTSTRSLQVCWAASVIVPILVALVPVDGWIDIDLVKEQADISFGAGAGNALVQSLRVLFALNYAVVLLPTLVSIPAGVMRGSLRVKSMLPTADVPGWFLVSVAPFYSLIAIVVFVLIDQIIGNGILVLGVGLIAASPWVYVLRRRVYVRPLTQTGDIDDLARADRIRAVMSWSGLGLVLLYALTSEIDGLRVLGTGDDAIFDYVQVGRTAAEVVSRGIVATVVFAGVFTRMTLTQWELTQHLDPAVRARHQADLAAIDAQLRRAGGTNGAPPR